MGSSGIRSHNCGCKTQLAALNDVTAETTSALKKRLTRPDRDFLLLLLRRLRTTDFFFLAMAAIVDKVRLALNQYRPHALESRKGVEAPATTLSVRVAQPAEWNLLKISLIPAWAGMPAISTTPGRRFSWLFAIHAGMITTRHSSSVFQEKPTLSTASSAPFTRLRRIASTAMCP